MNRRHFFQSMVAGAGLLTVASLFKTSKASAEERRRGGGAAAAVPKLVDPKDPSAKGVNYVHKHSDLKDKTLQLDRQGVKWVDQKCKGCSFFVSNGDKKVNGMITGGCSMPFAKDKLVAAEGWCSTWAKKS
jgi:hypothetical protein